MNLRLPERRAVPAEHDGSCRRAHRLLGSAWRPPWSPQQPLGTSAPHVRALRVAPGTRRNLCVVAGHGLGEVAATAGQTVPTGAGPAPGRPAAHRTDPLQGFDWPRTAGPGGVRPFLQVGTGDELKAVVWHKCAWVPASQRPARLPRFPEAASPVRGLVPESTRAGICYSNGGPSSWEYFDTHVSPQFGCYVFPSRDYRYNSLKDFGFLLVNLSTFLHPPTSPQHQ